jgi:hypothetical protein
MAAAVAAVSQRLDGLGDLAEVAAKTRLPLAEPPRRATVAETAGRPLVAHLPAVVAVQGVSGFRVNQRSVLPRLLMAVMEEQVSQALSLEPRPTTPVVAEVVRITTRLQHPNAVGVEVLRTTSTAQEMERMQTMG